MTGTTLLLLVLVAVISSVSYVRTKRALNGEAAERAKAEANANLAVEALDRAFERLYPTRMAVRTQPAIDGLPGDAIPVPSGPILSKETAALLAEMLPFYDRLAQQAANGDGLRFRTAEANRRVGAIRQRLGQLEDAVKSYQRAIDLFQELDSRSSTNSNLPLKMAQIQNELGRLFTGRREASEARQAHAAALALLEAAGAGSSDLPAMRFELARSYFFLGLRERPLPATATRDRSRPAPIPDDRRGSLAKAVALLKVLSAASPTNPEYQHLLALCYLEGADVEDGPRSQARDADERAIEILKSLVEAFPAIPDYAYDLSEAYMRIHLPGPPIPREVADTIEERFQRALALLERLVIKHPDVPDYVAAEARVHHKLGSFHRQLDHWEAAEQSFRKAVTVQAPLVRQFPDAPYYGLWLATFRLALADALIRRDQPGAARKELEETIAGVSLQLQQRPEMNSLHDLLALGYSQLEKTLRQLGEKPLADEAARKAEQERDAARRGP